MILNFLKKNQKQGKVMQRLNIIEIWISTKLEVCVEVDVF